MRNLLNAEGKEIGAEAGLNGGKYYADARVSPHVQASKYEKAPRR
jgi:hypothetical protein